MGNIAEAVSDYDKVPGDSSGREVRVCDYWDYTQLAYTRANVYRHPDHAFRSKLISAAVEIANNDNIGYEMSEERVTSYRAFQNIGWDISQIKNVGVCSIDCSEMMGCCVNFAVGQDPMGSDTWTGNIGERLLLMGFYDCGWSSNQDVLEAGDILVVHHDYQGTGHTGMYIGEGETMKPEDVWNHNIGIKYPDKDWEQTPAWAAVSWGCVYALEASQKCDKILEELKNIKIQGGQVDYDRIKKDVEEVQSKLKLVVG